MAGLSLLSLSALLAILVPFLLYCVGQVYRIILLITKESSGMLISNRLRATSGSILMKDEPSTAPACFPRDTKLRPPKQARTGQFSKRGQIALSGIQALSVLASWLLLGTLPERTDPGPHNHSQWHAVATWARPVTQLFSALFFFVGVPLGIVKKGTPLEPTSLNPSFAPPPEDMKLFPKEAAQRSPAGLGEEHGWHPGTC